jgi:acetyl esterase
MADGKASGPRDVDPQVREFIRRLAQDYAAHDAAADVVERRRIAASVREVWRSGGPEMAETRDLDVAGLRLRLYRPETQVEGPAMLYIHGGGWVLFSVDTHDRLMREYAHRAGIAVIGIDYTLSPEAKFPVALDEIGAALAWLEDAPLGIDPARLFVGGDSAGANLAVAACLRRREQGRRRLAGMLLNYGAFDPGRSASHDLYSAPEYLLESPEMDTFWAAYIDDPAQLADPLVAPLQADLHDLPPAFLAIAECDILADSNHAFAAKLERAGVPVEAVTYPGATHSFLEAVSISDLAGRALDDQARWIRERGDAG